VQGFFIGVYSIDILFWLLVKLSSVFSIFGYHSIVFVQCLKTR